MSKIKLPSFLNFNRSISPSEGLMYGVVDNDGTKTDVPVEVLRRGIRGAISNYSAVYKGEKADSDQNIAKQFDTKAANLQEIDVAYLPNGAEALKVVYSVVVQGNGLAPSGCNDVDFYDRLIRLTAAYKDKGGYEFLAERYAWNLINGRMLWRNRFAAKKAVSIAFDDQEITFPADGISLAQFNKSEMPEGFDVLAAAIAKALAGGNALFLTVSVVGHMPVGAEVFPSQEFIAEAKKAKEDGKVLSSIPVTNGGRAIRQATIHSQKIGNAIRVIDEWHGQVDDFGATPIEAYGYVQTRSSALRTGAAGGKDVYVLLKDIEGVTEQIEAAADASAISGDIHYLIAMLIRGGVFSGESKKG